MALPIRLLKDSSSINTSQEIKDMVLRMQAMDIPTIRRHHRLSKIHPGSHRTPV